MRNRAEVLKIVELYKGRVVDIAPESVDRGGDRAPKPRSTRSSRWSAPTASRNWSAPARSSCCAARLHRVTGPRARGRRFTGRRQGSMTARMYYDATRIRRRSTGRPSPIIGYGSQGHAHALNLHDSRRGRGGRAGTRVEEPRRWPRRPGSGSSTWPSGQGGGRGDDPVPDTAQKAVYDAEIEPNLRPGAAADVRPRLQHPVRADRAAGGRRRRAWSRRRAPATCLRSVYEPGGGVPALFAVRAGRVGHGARPRAGLRPGIGSTRAGVLETTFKEETETDLFGEQALLCGGVVGAGQGGLRDARRGRLPAGARLLRDDARAQADRRPDVPRRPQLHALQRQRHGRVRRLRVRARGSPRASRPP